MQFLKPTDIVDIVLQYVETEKANDIARDVAEFVNRKVEGAPVALRIQADEYGDDLYQVAQCGFPMGADRRGFIVCIEEIPKEGE